MDGLVRRAAIAVGVFLGVFGLTAGTALAHECINASKNEKNPHAGAQIVFGTEVVVDDDGEVVSETETILHITRGLAKRVEKGLVDAETGEGFHGIVGFQVTVETEDGDTVFEEKAHTFIVGPNDEIPHTAQDNGPTCRGISNIDDYFEECGDD